MSAGSTGFSEAVALAKAGEMKILAVTSSKRVPAFEDAPTLVEQGYNATFVNWRGFLLHLDFQRIKLTHTEAVIAKCMILANGKKSELEMDG